MHEKINELLTQYNEKAIELQNEINSYSQTINNKTLLLEQCKGAIGALNSIIPIIEAEEQKNKDKQMDKELEPNIFEKANNAE